MMADQKWNVSYERAYTPQYLRGRADFLDGREKAENPYDSFDHDHLPRGHFLAWRRDEWLLGYEDAEQIWNHRKIEGLTQEL